MDILALTQVINDWLETQPQLPDGSQINIKLSTYGGKVGVVKPAQQYLKPEEIISCELLDLELKEVAHMELWTPDGSSKGLCRRISNILLGCSFSGPRDLTVQNFFDSFPTQELFRSHPGVGSVIVTAIAEGMKKHLGYHWPEK